MRIIGLDPGLQHTGWGIIDQDGSRLSFVAAGRISSIASRALAERLVAIHHGLTAVIELHQPEAAAVEETFVNKNPTSTLKLGLARGVALLTPALHRLEVFEYPANLIKKSVVGAGHAGKEQVQMMVRVLLPASALGAGVGSPDAADALAVAICHAHHIGTLNRWGAKDFREAAR
jgi:crossover junction endodeoxyribonuclease RuvC